MPGDFKIFADRRLVYLNFSGDACIEDCLETISGLFASPEWRSDYAVLIDNSGITSYQGDFSELQRFCGRLRDSGALGTATMEIAYYAPSDLGFGIARMTQQVLSARLPLEIHVFREEAPALAKLGQRETGVAALLTAAA